MTWTVRTLWGGEVVYLKGGWGGEQGTGREEEVTENTFTFPLASSLPCFETMIAFLFTKEISEIGALSVKSGNQNLG